jgi:hypothetical protein
MVKKTGKLSIEFFPQGSRYEYEKKDIGTQEVPALTHVLSFCDELNKTFVTLFGGKHRPNTWWTEALDITPDAAGQVPTAMLVNLVNTRMASATINRTLMTKMHKEFGKGIEYAGANEPFPGDPGTGSGTEILMEFTVEAPTVVERTYYIGSDGKVHCTALLNLLANDNFLDLAEEGVTDSQVHVSLRVDFTDKS